MTVDEEFSKLDDDIRRLKIEYEVYFNGGTPRPPHDTLFRVESTIKRYSSDQSRLNFSQRFRFMSLVQKYSVHANLWRRKLQEKEEGRTLIGQQRRPTAMPPEEVGIRIVCSDPDTETEKVSQLLQAMEKARRQAGEPANAIDPAAFHKFIKAKTLQVKDALHCAKVQFTVSIEEGRVKFKAMKAD